MSPVVRSPVVRSLGVRSLSRCRTFRKTLLAWYDSHRRELPWRKSGDFYRVWISEIMLQQTRVEAVIPYYERFLTRFPRVEDLASAPEPDLLQAWSGLGYYSRARNLQRTAKAIAAAGLPDSFEGIRALPGIGPYTAAAVGSIALGLPHAAVDGNVLRVISRLHNDGSEISSPATRRDFGAKAQQLLDTARPGDFNQAMMELGATVCTPKNPACAKCPVTKFCEARAAGTAAQLPVRLKTQQRRDVQLDLAIIRRGNELFLVQRRASEKRLAGFWELPSKVLFPTIRMQELCRFRHQIVNDRFCVTVWSGSASGNLKQLPEAAWAAGGEWMDGNALERIPLTTVTKKALAGTR